MSFPWEKNMNDKEAQIIINAEQARMLKVIVVLIILIFGFVGFAIGYVYDFEDRNLCLTNPFTYGINEMNDLNEDEYLCTCNSNKGLKFYFNEEEVKAGSPFSSILNNG